MANQLDLFDFACFAVQRVSQCISYTVAMCLNQLHYNHLHVLHVLVCVCVCACVDMCVRACVCVASNKFKIQKLTLCQHSNR